ncbi:hypothetical protein A4G26_10865 [Mycobacterium kansasii]|uniref:Deazaflavin-dependent nitroreductase n=1 Tax=Mycobacterium innocens TaxID=2341083 RepID=A0A498Q0H4_9MYCO|nr:MULTISPECIES: nitroreductase/quinone reductase family protein [Mycobacterium]KZS61839.1 hypothetical protein A4G26_10865 [Mycobacterium kansasii]VBA39618.1 hypothetical protein LAUMK13_02661 [Mycobacterium innocens]
MTARYQSPTRTARSANTAVRWLAELGISIAGTRVLRVRGRKTGKLRPAVVNLLTVDGVDYVVSPRGDTQWARNVRAAGAVAIGPRRRSKNAMVSELADDAKPKVLSRYLAKWYWQVKGYVGGLTPQSGDDELRAAAPTIPAFALGKADC